MRSQLALFFIGLICLSSVASLNQDVAFLRQLKKQQFGKTLVEAIQIQLNTATGKDAVDRILNLLSEIKTQVLADGAQDKQEQEAFEAKTNQRINDLTARIASLVGQINDDENLIKLNNAVIAQAEKDLVFQHKQLEEDQRLLQVNLETQAQTTATYKEQFTALSNQITALASARQLLSNMAKGSFVQTTAQQFVQLSSSLNNIQFSHPKFAGFVSILSEMLTNVERIHSVEHANNVIALIDSLYDQLVKEAENLTAVYKRRMIDLQLIQERLQYSIEAHNAEIARLEQLIAQKQSSNVQANQRILNNQQRKAESEAERADQQRQLADSKVAYAQRVAKRAEEVQILDRVSNIFQTRLTDEVRSSVKVL